MNENRNNRLPTGLLCLLIYQCILVLVAFALGYNIASMLGVWGPGTTLTASGVVVFWLQLLVLACWSTAIGFASMGMVRRSPRGLLVGMICHVILEIVALPMMLGLGFMGLSSFGRRGEEGAWAEMFLLFALMWFPIVSVSAWAFLYLRKLRKQAIS
jgi:hypothetical protein